MRFEVSMASHQIYNEQLNSGGYVLSYISNKYANCIWSDYSHRNTT